MHNIVLSHPEVILHPHKKIVPHVLLNYTASELRYGYLGHIFPKEDFFFSKQKRLDFSFVRSHAFNKGVCVDFFNKIHDMNGEKL